MSCNVCYTDAVAAESTAADLDESRSVPHYDDESDVWPDPASPDFDDRY